MPRKPMSPKNRKQLSETMKARWEAARAASNGGTRLALHTNIVLTINDRELTLTVDEAAELLRLLTAAMPPQSRADQAIA